MHEAHLTAIKKFEGFSPRAEWDYAQHSNGYGTKAKYAGEIIDRTEAENRFRAEIAEAADKVEKFAPNLDSNTKAALTSLTFNAGTKWMSSGLGAAIRAGDLETAKQRFVLYNRAGGQVLPGLAARRLQEADWFASPGQASQIATAVTPPATSSDAGNTKVITSTDRKTAVCSKYDKPANEPQVAGEQATSLPPTIIESDVRGAATAHDILTAALTQPLDAAPARVAQLRDDAIPQLLKMVSDRTDTRAERRDDEREPKRGHSDGGFEAWRMGTTIV